MSAQEIIQVLSEVYKDSKTALRYSSPFELLVAVVLSAQCTDERVNKVTARLFPRLATPEAMAALEQEELEELIKDCGLYHTKARHLLALSRQLLQRFQGQVPATVAELESLSGVGRKTANVVASIVYQVPAIAVDTHVFRVAHRLGLAQGRDALATEQELQRLIPREQWSAAHHWLIWHGRQLCKARKPLCGSCPLEALCPYEGKNLGERP